MYQLWVLDHEFGSVFNLVSEVFYVSIESELVGGARIAHINVEVDVAVLCHYVAIFVHSVNVELYIHGIREWCIRALRVVLPKTQITLLNSEEKTWGY